MNLILFGFKGAGKTHFGKLLALKLHRPFIDTDDLIIELSGKRAKIKEIYAAVGEEGFRELEKRAISTLKEIKNAVIALGGGTVLDAENVEMLQKIGALIYLKAAPEKLKKRIFKDELPAFLDNEDAFWQMIQQREPIYRSVRARVVDTDALDEAGVIASLMSALTLEDPPDGL